MKQFSKFLTLAFAAASLVACTGTKKQNNEIVKMAKDTLTWSGTYEGVSPAADCPGIYTLLALNDKGEYQLYEKYLERAAVFVSKGTIEWNASGDSIAFLPNKTMVYKVENDVLSGDRVQLTRVSDEKTLSESYTTELIKNNTTGDNIPVSIYFDGDKSMADFRFDGKDYSLPQATDNTQEMEFAADGVSLVWNISDPAPLPDFKPQLTIDGKAHNFTHISPVNIIYLTDNADAPAKAFDVMYFNIEDGKAFVKLMSAEPGKYYTLPLTSASAKTADYEKDGVKWSTDNKKGAVLSMDGKEYKYMEMTLEK